MGILSILLFTILQCDITTLTATRLTKDSDGAVKEFWNAEEYLPKRIPKITLSDLESTVRAKNETFLSRKNNLLNYQPPLLTRSTEKIAHRNLKRLESKKTSKLDVQPLAEMDRPPITNSFKRPLEKSESRDEHFTNNNRNSQVPNKEKKKSRRFKRATTYEIEILMLADFSIYSYWKDRASGSTEEERTTNAINYLEYYFVSLFRSINLRFESLTGFGYEVKLLLAELYIAVEAVDAPWTETEKNIAFAPPRVNAANVLDTLQFWINSNMDNLPEHDHAMLFTAYDLEIDGSNTIHGWTSYGGLCNPTKPSVVEFSGDVITATIAAQMIGYSMGAVVDGIGNSCPQDGNYVMDATPTLINDAEYNRRQWLFSSCSQLEIDEFITALNSAGANCMISRSPDYDEPFNVDAYALPGQTYTPDRHCEAVQGTGSYLCRETLNSDYTTICALMACSFVVNNGTCIYRLPWEGTSCGDRKICEKGFCVESSEGPTIASETCIFEDQPENLANQIYACDDGIFTTAYHKRCYLYEEECCNTCDPIKDQYSNFTDCRYGDQVDGCDHGSLCYTGSNVPLCCALCQKSYTGVQDCEYGDLTPACTHGSFCYVPDNIPYCCALCVEAYTGVQDCEYGDMNEQCEHGSLCYTEENRPICCSLCETSRTEIPGCEYGDQHPDCSHSSVCYVEGNRPICCSICNTSYTGEQDCEYGDKDPACVLAIGSYCYGVAEYCCETCKQFETGVPGCEYGDMSPECTHAGLCYLEANVPICCSLCSAAFTNDTGCEYGDRIDWCDVNKCTSYDEYTFGTRCCRTCANITTTTTVTSTTVTPVTNTKVTVTTLSSVSTVTTVSTTKTPTVSTTTEPIKPVKPVIPIIIGVIIGGVLVIVVIVTTVCCLLKRQVPGQKIVPNEAVVEANSTELKEKENQAEPAKQNETAENNKPNRPPLISWKVTGNPANFRFSPAPHLTGVHRTLSPVYPLPKIPPVIPPMLGPEPILPPIQDETVIENQSNVVTENDATEVSETNALAVTESNA